VALVVVALAVVALAVVVAFVVVAFLVDDAGGGVTVVDILLALTADDVSGVLVSEFIVTGFVVVILTFVVAGVLMLVAEDVEGSDGSVELIWSASSSKASIVIAGN